MKRRPIEVDRFDLASCLADPMPAIEHARKTGRAVVVDEDGKVRMTITIPTEDLIDVEAV